MKNLKTIQPNPFIMLVLGSEAQKIMCLLSAMHCFLWKRKSKEFYSCLGDVTNNTTYVVGKGSHYLSPHNNPRIGTIILVHIRKQRHRKVKRFSKGHTARNPSIWLQQKDEEYSVVCFSVWMNLLYEYIFIDFLEENIGDDILITVKM